MSRHKLSKSTFIRGNQCLKSLYLYKKKYNLRDPLSPEQRAIFSRGTKVGKIAQELFPGGTDSSPKTPFQYPQAVEKTARLLNEGETIIYEACFQFNEVLVALDILVKDEAGWKAFEVKSSKSISETYLLDAALQYYVITGSGLKLTDFSLIHIDEHYVKQGPVDLHRLFTSRSVVTKILPKQSFIEQQIEKEKQSLSLANAPQTDIGAHCYSPYPCDFIGHCWKQLPQNSVFKLSLISKEQQFKWYHAGIITPELIDLSEELNPQQQQQIKSHSKQKEIVETVDLKNFLQQLGTNYTIVKPLDYRPAIPWAEGSHPYQQIFVGFSIETYIKNTLSDTKHFLAESPEMLSQQLPAAFPQFDPLHNFVFYSQEDAKLWWNTLLERNDETGNYFNRSFAIQPLIQQLKYYHPNLQGDFSLPKLAWLVRCKSRFTNWENIGSDVVARVAYQQLIESNDEELKQETRQKLESYAGNSILVIKRFLDLLQKKI